MSKLYLFADNAKLNREIDNAINVEILQEYLKILQNRSRNSLLFFNVDQCAQMTIAYIKADNFK